MAADAAAAASGVPNGLPADASKCLIKVVTDAGKKYTLEVKGDISTLRAEMLKPKLAEKTGVPARKQILSYKGQKLGDKASFKDLGIAPMQSPDDVLRLSREASETSYYVDVLGDSMRSFDDLLANRGGVAEFDFLTAADKKQLLKELGRKVKSMRKNLDYLAEEDEHRTLVSQIQAFTVDAEQREAVLRSLENPALRGSASMNSFNSSVVTSVSTPAAGGYGGDESAGNLIRRCRQSVQQSSATSSAAAAASSPSDVAPVRFGLNSVMIAFYERLHYVYCCIDSVKRRADAGGRVAGSLLRLVIDLKVLLQDVLNCRSKTAAEVGIMQGLVTDARTVLIKHIVYCLNRPNCNTPAGVSCEEVVLSLRNDRAPYTVSPSDLPPSEQPIIDLLRAAESGTADAQVVLLVLRKFAGFPAPASHAAAAAAAPAPTSSSSGAAPTAAAAAAAPHEDEGGLAAPAPTSSPSPSINAPTKQGGGAAAAGAGVGLPAATAGAAALPTAAAASDDAVAAAVPAAAEPQQPPPAEMTEAEVDEMLQSAIREGDVWKTRLVLFYRRYNPDNLSSISEILREFVGTEDALFAQLFEKYRLGDEDKRELGVAFAKVARENKMPPPQKAPVDDSGCSVM
eukprot:Rhum_TRINITY_DN14820_c4_g1::Rhum_TRINITY_DN14820_c4_g1_i1::g.120787::m.120787